jgi:hypothetical protein
LKTYPRPSGEFGKGEIPNMGNDTGDDVGKSDQEDGESTSLFLGDEIGKDLGDEYGNCFSPGKQGLRERLFFWSMKGFAGDAVGKYRVFR